MLPYFNFMFGSNKNRTMGILPGRFQVAQDINQLIDLILYLSV